MAKLKSYFFTSFRETAEEKDETNEEEEKTREGADAPFHRHVQKKSPAADMRVHIYRFVSVCVYISTQIFAKYIQSVHHYTIFNKFEDDTSSFFPLVLAKLNLMYSCYREII